MLVEWSNMANKLVSIKGQHKGTFRKTCKLETIPTSDWALPQAFQISNIAAVSSNGCSTPLHLSVMWYWCGSPTVLPWKIKMRSSRVENQFNTRSCITIQTFVFIITKKVAGYIFGDKNLLAAFHSMILQKLNCIFPVNHVNLFQRAELKRVLRLHSTSYSMSVRF